MKILLIIGIIVFLSNIVARYFIWSYNKEFQRLNSSTLQRLLKPGEVVNYEGFAKHWNLTTFIFWTSLIAIIVVSVSLLVF